MIVPDKAINFIDNRDDILKELAKLSKEEYNQIIQIPSVKKILDEIVDTHFTKDEEWDKLEPTSVSNEIKLLPENKATNEYLKFIAAASLEQKDANVMNLVQVWAEVNYNEERSNKENLYDIIPKDPEAHSKKVKVKENEDFGKQLLKHVDSHSKILNMLTTKMVDNNTYAKFL